MPRLNLKTLSNDGKSGVFEISPLLKGFGNTLGSVLRRTLYSASEGSVITQVNIEGVTHQFTTITGAKEDVMKILLNLKKVRFEKTVEGPVELSLSVSGPATVTAKDIEEVTGCKVVNPDVVITELADKKAKIKATLIVETGVGFVPAPENITAPIGTISLDSNFSPIYSVSVLVEDARVGREANYDKLVISIKTDGSIDPHSALLEASRNLKEYFYRIETGQDYTDEQDKLMQTTPEEVANNAMVPADEVSLEELHLPTRTINALKKSGIRTLGDLADRSEDDLLRIRNLGEKSIREIFALLERENLK